MGGTPAPQCPHPSHVVKQNGKAGLVVFCTLARRHGSSEKSRKTILELLGETPPNWALNVAVCGRVLSPKT